MITFLFIPEREKTTHLHPAMGKTKRPADLNGVPDTHNLVRAASFFLGIGMLSPYCAVIGAPDYWVYITKEESINADMIMLYMVFNFLGLIACIVMSEKIPAFNLHPGKVIAAGFAFFLCPLLVFLFSSAPSSGALMFLSCFLGIGQAVSQTESFRLIAALPGIYTGDCVSGQALAGLFFSVFRLLIKSGKIGEVPSEVAGIGSYFCVCLFIVCLCVGVSLILPNTPFVEFHRNRTKPATSAGLDEYKELFSSELYEFSEEPGAGKSMVKQDDSGRTSAENTPFPLTLKEVAFALKTPGFLLFLDFFVSLLVFPGVISEIPSAGNLGTYFPVINGLSFNFFDLAGRLSASSVSLPKRRWKLFIWGRALVFPVLLSLCVLNVLQSDILVFLLVALLAVSNGYFASVLMQDAPTMVHKQDRSTASQFMVIMLVSGLTAGAVCGDLLARALMGGK